MCSPYLLSSPPRGFPASVCVCVCFPCWWWWCVSQQHSDVSVLEFHLERTPLLTSPHPPELTGQSVTPLDFTSSMLSVCDTLRSACLWLSVLLGLYLKAGLPTVIRKVFIHRLPAVTSSTPLSLFSFIINNTVFDSFYFYVCVSASLHWKYQKVIWVTGERLLIISSSFICVCTPKHLTWIFASL